MKREIYIKMPDSIVRFSQACCSRNTWREEQVFMVVEDGEVVTETQMHNHEVGQDETQMRCAEWIKSGGRVLFPSDLRCAQAKASK